MHTRDGLCRLDADTLIDGVSPELSPPWWAYEGEVKRRVALEVTLRRLFSLTPGRRPGRTPGLGRRRAQRSRQG